MPVSMNGVPHWRRVELETTDRHIPFTTTKKYREAEFQARQAEYKAKEETARLREKEARKEMMSRLETRLEFEPGYGPTKWLWPTAMKYPRHWNDGGDLLMDPTKGPSEGDRRLYGTPWHDYPSSRSPSPTKRIGVSSPSS